MNLLAALDVLLEEGSVGAAADRLHLSQPAMSRTLSRIRKATGDEILVRSGRAMIPTPYAVDVRDEVHRLAEQVRAVLSPERELRLAELETSFTLRCHDAVTNALAPRLIARLRGEAPGVRLRFLAESSADDSGLRTGRTDLEIGSAAAATADVESHTISSGRFVVAMRRDHRLARGTLTATRYAAAEHVTVSRRGRFSDPVDEALARVGLSRTVIATAPTSTAALHIVHGGDALTAVPDGICGPDILALDLVALPLPLELPGLPMVMSWHARNNGDSAHRWLRTVVRNILTEITGELG